MGYVDKAGKVKPLFAWTEDYHLKLRAKFDADYFLSFGGREGRGRGNKCLWRV
jgi:hypothetical protein